MKSPSEEKLLINDRMPLGGKGEEENYGRCPNPSSIKSANQHKTKLEEEDKLNGDSKDLRNM